MLHIFKNMALHKRCSIDLQKTEFLVIFHVNLDIPIVIIFLDDGSSRDDSHNLPAWSPDFSSLVYCVWYG